MIARLGDEDAAKINKFFYSNLKICPQA
jgi:hypothetical protein